MDSVTLSLALVAGAVAAFNPCGFALLPAYLTVLVLGETPHAGGGTRASLRRGVRFSVGMTVGFVVVFAVAGVALAALTAPIERYLPIVTIVIGIVLIVVGAQTLAGRPWAIKGLQGRGAGPTTAWLTQVQYGITFALASLSCTIGPFLAVTSGTLFGSGALEVVGAFVAYALGMGAVVGALALVTVLASGTAVARIRRAAPVIARVSGALLVVAGAYVAWYGWFELRVLGGTQVDDPVVEAALGIQRDLTQAVDGLGVAVILVALAAVVAVAVVALRRGQLTRDR